ncbi:MAG: hypothetical protein SGJ00_12635 [bacterium]|nr:hypothetical protein [bacterium]
MKKLAFNLSASLCFFLPLISNSQTAEYPWALGVHVGISEYNGDLGNGFFHFSLLSNNFYDADNTLIQTNEPGFSGFSINRYINKRFDLALSYSHGEWGYHNLSGSTFFFRRIDAVDLHIKWKFATIRDGLLTPFVVSGLGYRNVNLPAQNDTAMNEINVALGVGMIIRISKYIGINLQSNYAYTTSDAGDGKVSTMNSINDQFWNHSVGISFSLGNLGKNHPPRAKRIKCPKSLVFL